MIFSAIPGSYATKASKILDMPEPEKHGDNRSTCPPADAYGADSLVAGITRTTGIESIADKKNASILQRLFFSKNMIRYEFKTVHVLPNKKEEKMVKIPVAVENRLKSAVPKCKTHLKTKMKDKINEANTADIVTYILEKMFGFKGMYDIEKEFSIGADKCDIAVKLKGKPVYLIEIKRLGTTLRDKHIKQAVGYASHSGIEDIVLTNGVEWRVYRVTAQGIKLRPQPLCKIDFLNLNTRRKEEIEHLFLLSKWGIRKNAIADFYEHCQVFNECTIGRLLLTEPVLQVVHRQMRKLKDGTKKVTLDRIQELMKQKVIQPDILNDKGEKGKEARKLVNRLEQKRKKSATQRPS